MFAVLPHGPSAIHRFFRPFLFTFSLYPAFAASSDTLTPRQVLRRFDSLLEAGAEPEAGALCIGMALRMLPVLAEAHLKLASFLDRAKSRDSVLEEKCGGRWCALKAVSDAVFLRPLMGLEQIRSVQALHLFRKPEGWRLAEFEELADEKAPLLLRQGEPSEFADSSAPLFPVSRLAPERRGAERLRFRAATRNGDSLPLPEGPGQKVIRRGRDWAEVETLTPPPLRERGPIALNGGGVRELASNPYLDLTDSLLLSKAMELRPGAEDDLKFARSVYAFVSSSFAFRLGATLFGTSREVLRRLEGDCSEAAVLAAALLRAGGIPSRVVLGFATSGRGVFIGHAWTEAHVNGRWMGMDAALREFPAGAERLALLRLDGTADMRVAASNLMLKTLSNLEIEIQGAWAGGKPLPLIEHPGNAAEGRAFFEDILRGIGK